MQSIQALEVRLSQEAPVRCDVTLEQVKGFASKAALTEAIALLMVDEELGVFADEAAGVVFKRGIKNKATPLSHYFAKSNGTVALTTGYQVPGKAFSGVCDLLSFLKKRQRCPLCLIGLPRKTFDELRERSCPAAFAPCATEGELDSIQRVTAMLDEGEPVEVPAELCGVFVGTSLSMQTIRRLIMCAARTETPVLIEGETGTGKEVIAQQIHKYSSRRDGGIYPVNCGAISPELLESELFGHERGAFTGAYATKVGMWTHAKHGTLFLDEIGDLSPGQQVKVLRALDENGYLAVGATRPIVSNARIIAATNRNLVAMVKDGLFREDLYYRLFSFRIKAVPLRHHAEDIPPLALHFWRKLCGSKRVPELSHDVLEELKLWRWPGNARELKSFLANTFAFAGARPVTVELVRNVFKDRLGPQVAVLGNRDS